MRREEDEERERRRVQEAFEKAEADRIAQQKALEKAEKFRLRMMRARRRMRGGGGRGGTLARSCPRHARARSNDRCSQGKARKRSYRCIRRGNQPAGISSHARPACSVCRISSRAFVSGRRMPQRCAQRWALRSPRCALHRSPRDPSRWMCPPPLQQLQPARQSPPHSRRHGQAVLSLPAEAQASTPRGQRAYQQHAAQEEGPYPHAATRVRQARIAGIRYGAYQHPLPALSLAGSLRGLPASHASGSPRTMALDMARVTLDEVNNRLQFEDMGFDAKK